MEQQQLTSMIATVDFFNAKDMRNDTYSIFFKDGMLHLWVDVKHFQGLRTYSADIASFARRIFKMVSNVQIAYTLVAFLRDWEKAN